MTTAEVVLEILLISMAAGRVSYCIAKEEIFRPVREFVWRYSAPSTATDRDGRPWRMLHWYKTNEFERSNGEGRIAYEFHSDGYMLRDPGFFGQLIECPYCLSFWMTLFTAFVYSAHPAAILMLALWFLSSLAVRLMP